MTQDPFAHRAARTYGEAFRSVRVRVDRSSPLRAAGFLAALAIAMLLLLPLILLVVVVTAVLLALLWLKRLVAPRPRGSGMGGVQPSRRGEGRRNVRVIAPRDE